MTCYHITEDSNICEIWAPSIESAIRTYLDYTAFSVYPAVATIWHYACEGDYGLNKVEIEFPDCNISINHLKDRRIYQLSVNN